MKDRRAPEASPREYLEEVERAEQARLIVYAEFAAGVGKTH